MENPNQSKTPSKKRYSEGSSSSGPNSNKKRGRPFGSKNKSKPGFPAKRRRVKKGGKKKKFELSKPKTAEVPAKPKPRAKAFNGPYVHIVGSRIKPSSISVVNIAQKEEEKVSKTTVKRNFKTSSANRIKKNPVGHLSTLSPTYDAFNRDKTWLCMFCRKGSHISGLGDLYGPYYIKDKNSEQNKPSTSRGKKRKSDHDEGKTAKRSRQSAGGDSTPKRGGGVGGVAEGENPDMREVWIHEDCAIWCQSVTLTGEEVHGLEEAVAEASENTCCKCNHIGATLGCWGKACKEMYHYVCAKMTGCQMDIENFSLLCPKHQKKNSEAHGSRN